MHPIVFGHVLGRFVFVAILGIALVGILIFYPSSPMVSREQVRGVVVESFPKAAIVELSEEGVKVHVTTPDQRVKGESVHVWRETNAKREESYSLVTEDLSRPFNE